MFDRIHRSLTALVRGLQLLRHIAKGVMTVAVLFPYMKPSDRDRVISRWCHDALRFLNVRVRVTGEIPTQWTSSILIVANHVSWIDILAINAVKRVRFVAKSEVRNWPIIGWLAAKTGTIFLDRDRPRQLVRANRSVRTALARGQCVAVFPEGTTSNGRSVLHFHSGLLEPAVSGEAIVWPVALRFRNSFGRVTDIAAFVGDQSLVASMWRVMSQPTILLELHFAEPLEGSRADRHQLSETARFAILSRLCDTAQPPFTDPPYADPSLDWPGQPITTA